jgi:hypothetical protein
MEQPIEINGRKTRFPVDVKAGINWAALAEVPR